MTESTSAGHAVRRPVLLPALGRLVALWRRRATTRTHLADLDPRMLRDVGLEPEAARREARKPFWL